METLGLLAVGWVIGLVSGDLLIRWVLRAPSIGCTYTRVPEGVHVSFTRRRFYTRSMLVTNAEIDKLNDARK